MNRRSNQHSNKYSSLEELYIENRKLIYAFLSDIVEDESLKDDLASAVWVKVFKKSEMFLKMNKRWVKNYLRVMVRNCLLYTSIREQSLMAKILLISAARK